MKAECIILRLDAFRFYYTLFCIIHEMHCPNIGGIFYNVGKID